MQHDTRITNREKLRNLRNRSKWLSKRLGYDELGQYIHSNGWANHAAHGRWKQIKPTIIDCEIVDALYHLEKKRRLRNDEAVRYLKRAVKLAAQSMSEVRRGIALLEKRQQR